MSDAALRELERLRGDPEAEAAWAHGLRRAGRLLPALAEARQAAALQPGSFEAGGAGHAYLSLLRGAGLPAEPLFLVAGEAGKKLHLVRSLPYLDTLARNLGAEGRAEAQCGREVDGMAAFGWAPWGRTAGPRLGAFCRLCLVTSGQRQPFEAWCGQVAQAGAPGPSWLQEAWREVQRAELARAADEALERVARSPGYGLVRERLGPSWACPERARQRLAQARYPLLEQPWAAAWPAAGREASVAFLLAARAFWALSEWPSPSIRPRRFDGRSREEVRDHYAHQALSCAPPGEVPGEERAMWVVAEERMAEFQAACPWAHHGAYVVEVARLLGDARSWLGL